MFVMKFRLVPPDPQPDPKGVPTLLAEDHHLSGLVDLEDWVRLELASGASRALAALEGPLRHEAREEDAARIAALLAGGASAQSNTTPDEYRAMVARAKDYILAGDVFLEPLS